MKDDRQEDSLNPSSIRYIPLGGSPGVYKSAIDWTETSEPRGLSSWKVKVAQVMFVLVWVGMIALGIWSEHPHHH